MEKRKRRGVYRKVSVSDESPKSSQMDSLSEKKLCNEVENVSIEPSSSPIGLSDVSVKAASQSSQLSVKHNHLNRPLFVRKPRYCDWKYSLRNLNCNAADASTSHGNGNGNAQYIEKIISNDPRLQTGQSSQTQERNISSILAAANVVVSGGDSRRILLCGICERGLSRNPINVGGNTTVISGGEPSVVAVLVCGHLYHADCLEQRTCIEERMDPSCPLCV